MKREVIILNIGGTGVNLSHPIWKQFNAEQDIDMNGNLINKNHQNENNLHNFYHQTKNGHFIPRNLSVKFDGRYQNKN